MATKLPWWEIKTQDDADKMVGKIVYQAYTPSKVGKIITCTLKAEPWRDEIYIQVYCDVKMLKTGKTITSKLSDWNDFEALIEDHERKAKNQRKILRQAKEL